MGERAYGISAGAGSLHYTFRTWTVEEMLTLKNRLVDSTTEVCQKYHLRFTTDWFDYFPASVNDTACLQLLKHVANNQKLDLIERPIPLKFGEDFGWYSARYPAVLFGLGAGESTPALHHHDYDFPEELIETGVSVFVGMIGELLG